MDERRPGVEPLGSRYEERDVQVRPIVIFGLGLLVLTLAVLLLMGWMFTYLAARQAKVDVPRSPLAIGQQLPPEPRLEVALDQALRELRAEEDATLHSYSWVDREAGIVRIPIERAMALLAERGLPTRTEDGRLPSTDR